MQGSPKATMQKHRYSHYNSNKGLGFLVNDIGMFKYYIHTDMIQKIHC